MSTIDWTQRDFIFILAGSGVLLIVLSLLIRFRSAKRSSFLMYAIGILGGLVLGAAGGLYYVPPPPDRFSNPAAWYTVERGDIVSTVDEFGWVLPLDVTHVACMLHRRTPSGLASNVRWVIDEGKLVKKGDLLGELDDSEWREQLKEQTIPPERRKFLEEQVAKCRILAPRDGIAIYYILPRTFGSGPWLAQGEPVGEGQKLFSIFDPVKMGVRTHISPPQISLVKVGQVARIHIDGFPDRAFEGQVSSIANMPTKFGAKEVAYTVELRLSDPVARLAPEMRARVSLQLARRKNALHVPTEALLHNGSKTFCFVKSGRQIDIRTVYIGLSGSQFTVVEDGLREGEQVLRGGAWQRFSVSAKEW